MTLERIAEILEARVAVGAEYLDRQVECAGAADMQSVILAKSHSGMLLLSGQLSPQTIRSCSLSDVSAVVLVRDTELPPSVQRLAAERGMVVLIVPCTLYETCGRLYAAGLPGVKI